MPGKYDPDQFYHKTGRNSKPKPSGPWRALTDEEWWETDTYKKAAREATLRNTKK